jgi:hypothetical protein
MTRNAAAELQAINRRDDSLDLEERGAALEPALGEDRYNSGKRSTDSCYVKAVRFRRAVTRNEPASLYLYLCII